MVEMTSEPPGTPILKRKRIGLFIAAGCFAACVCLTVAAVAVWYIIGQQGRSDQANWGPEHNTPATSLQLVEAKRETIPGDSKVLYTVKATGLPQGVIFGVWNRMLSKEPVLVLSQIYLDTKGRLVSKDSPAEEFQMGIQKYARGEPFEIALISEDEQTRVYGRVVPFPIEATGAGGCRLQVELARDDGKMFFISGSGFVPGEQVTWTSVSAGERIADVTTVKSDGALDRVFFLPAVIGKPFGVDRYSVQGSRCSVELEYEWGLPALKPQ
jgi:hypothetical protein